MMLQVKQQFQPSLDPISEILEENQLDITKPITRNGTIRREVGFIYTWKTRSFTILYIPSEKITLSVYNKDSKQPEEIINLGEARLSKKCTEIDKRICFGLVTKEKKKYLISLNTARECLKYFYQIASAKKMLKSNMFRDSNNQLNAVYTQAKQHTLQKPKSLTDQGQEVKEVKAQIQNHQIENQEKNNVTKQLSQFYSCVSIDDDQSKAVRKKPEISLALIEQVQKNMQLNNLKKVDEIDNMMYHKISSFQGFKKIDQFCCSTIYEKKKNQIKIVSVIEFDHSTRSIVELFINFDCWNKGVKRFNILNPVQKGVYRVETQFYKKGCFSKEKQSRHLLSLYKIEHGYFLNMKPFLNLPNSIKPENWITFSLSLSITQNIAKFSEKTLIISIKSSEGKDKALSEFARDMKDFKQYLKTKVQLPHKLLQMKGDIQN